MLVINIYICVLARLQPRSAWTSHPQLSGMLLCIDLLKTAAPMCAVVENVLGFNMLHHGSSVTPYQFFVQKLPEFECAEVVVDMSHFHRFTRRRTGNLLQ